MEDPLQEVGTVVHKLTQGSPVEQKKALETYFTEDAAFYHPFCRVDSAPGSRARVLSIFRWYKILSPKIELDIQSIAYDEVKQILYVTIHQVFAIWMLFGLSNADVVLTTKLQLEKKGKKYYIKSQNDLYQVDQFAKFISIRGTGAYLVMAWHWFSTLVCVLLARTFGFVTSAEQWYYDRGHKQIEEARGKGVHQLADEARKTTVSKAEHARQRVGQQVNGQVKKLESQQKSQ